MNLRCPICKKLIQDTETDVPPFCSKRCKLTDLGAWITGEYRVPCREEEQEDEDEIDGQG